MKRNKMSPTETPARPSRQARKAELEARIEEQRIDTLMAAERWHLASRPLEARWDLVSRYRKPLLLGSGLLLTIVLRQPGQALKIANRVTMSALTLKRLSKLLT